MKLAIRNNIFLFVEDPKNYSKTWEVFWESIYNTYHTHYTLRTHIHSPAHTSNTNKTPAQKLHFVNFLSATDLYPWFTRFIYVFFDTITKMCTSWHNCIGNCKSQTKIHFFENWFHISFIFYVSLEKWTHSFFLSASCRCFTSWILKKTVILNTFETEFCWQLRIKFSDFQGFWQLLRSAPFLLLIHKKVKFCLWRLLLSSIDENCLLLFFTVWLSHFLEYDYRNRELQKWSSNKILALSFIENHSPKKINSMSI